MHAQLVSAQQNLKSRAVENVIPVDNVIREKSTVEKSWKHWFVPHLLSYLLRSNSRIYQSAYYEAMHRFTRTGFYGACYAGLL